MQDIARLATLEALILALALWLWPFFSRIGIIAPPDTGVIIDTPSTSLTAPTIKTPADVILQYKQNAENWTQQPPNGITFLSQIEQRVFELTNAERRKNGLSPLQPDNLLQKTA
ncbi:MAG: hypothetical protein ABFR82_18060, partial [Nitrospirota bacterium]